VNALVELPVARLARTPRAWAPLVAWSFFALGAAVALRRSGAPSSVGDALLSPYGSIALPLLVYAVVGAALGGDGLSRSVRSLARFGASPQQAALATLLVAAGASAALASLVGVLVVALAHGPADPPALRDALTVAWVAALAGAAYAGLFGLGASFGKRGGGRTAVLVLEWLLGGSSGVVGLVTPRAHLRSLLGGPASDGLSGHASALALAALALGFTALAARRARRV
jgi:hypothetical protein